VRRLRRTALGGRVEVPGGNRLRELEEGPLGLSAASADIRRWWADVERQLHLERTSKLRLAEELAVRGLRVTHLHLAAGRSGTRDLNATLYLAQYLRRLDQIGGKGLFPPPRRPGQGYLF
jgi:hypothetical protein